jgi:hypothetical protein
LATISSGLCFFWGIPSSSKWLKNHTSGRTTFQGAGQWLRSISAHWVLSFVDGSVLARDFLSVSDRCSLRSCVRPVGAVLVTAGLDEVRVPGPNQTNELGSCWPSKSPIAHAAFATSPTKSSHPFIRHRPDHRPKRQ